MNFFHLVALRLDIQIILGNFHPYNLQVRILSLLL